MQNKGRTGNGLMKILTFVLNSIYFGIPIRNVEYMEPIKGEMDIHKMSDTPDYVKGLAMLHGISVPVYRQKQLILLIDVNELV